MTKLTRKIRCVLAAALFAAVQAQGEAAQTSAVAASRLSPQAQPAASASALPTSGSLVQKRPGTLASAPATLPSASQPLFDYQDSDIKFRLESLMAVLRDARHEGWILAAYPDPKTSKPLIGAGFSLDVAETQHPQLDPLNPRPFIEPSSAQLWKAAGLDPVQLEKILDQFDRDLQAWKKKKFRKKIRTQKLAPQLTQEEAMSLLRISTVQAVNNARAYCRNFDRITASQQMALTELVFQMGVNLEEFVQFLAALNGDGFLENVVQPAGYMESDRQHWKTVQQTLIESQWAHRYRTRAIAVIAMFNPDYAENPRRAEHHVQASLRPPSRHRRKKSHVQSAHLSNPVNQAPASSAPSL